MVLMNKFRVEEWTEKECELLNEMKDRCLNGGKYKDEKAKEKFKMICHLEDYCVQYYQLLDYINQLETNRDELIEYSHKRLGFLENCVGGDVELIHTQISVYREYLKILERGKE